MSAWKQFERDVARLLGGARFWANSGEKLDVASDSYIGQCKLVKTCSLESLSQLVEQVDRDASADPRHRVGVVAIKVRRGSGRKSPTLMVVSAETWERMHGAAPAPLSFFAPSPADPQDTAQSPSSPHHPR